MAAEELRFAAPADADELATADIHAQLAEEALGLAGSLNLRRTVLGLLTLLRPRLADWAMVVMLDSVSGGLKLFGGNDASFRTIIARGAAGPGLLGVLRSGRTEHLDVAANQRLSSLVPHPMLRDEVLHHNSAHVLGLGLIASELQHRLRPATLPEIDGLRLAARYRPAAEHLDIGGDFYDVHGSDDNWLISLGDVSGKGVEAAVLTDRVRQSIRTAAYFDRRPGTVLGALNTVLLDAGSDRFVTVLCARVRPAAGGSHAEVELAAAGHTPPIVLRANGLVEHITVSGMAIGLRSAVHYLPATLRLNRGDTMLMFTDGIDEAQGDNGFYGLERLTAFLPAYAGAAPDVICEAIERDVVEHLDGRSHDDIALLAVTCGD